ncbi:MAG: hypothetical protein AAF090_01265 [Bacteroidota bacterium]
MIIATIALTLGIAYFIGIQTKRNTLRQYEATVDCENTKLEYFHQTFKIGDEYSVVKNTLSGLAIPISDAWTNEGNHFIRVNDILMDCPISGRPYCGILFEFKKSRLIAFYSGYPCH